MATAMSTSIISHMTAFIGTYIILEAVLTKLAKAIPSLQ